jgi:putative spermidine/putrescine transport system substrate-binding protein
MKISRRSAIVLAVLALIGGAAAWGLSGPDRLTVVSWGGAYSRAQTLALFHPYEDKNRVDLMLDNYSGGLKEIEAQVKSGNVDWDVVDLELEDAATACRAGLLERLDGLELRPGTNGAAATRDFVPGAIGPCWVGSVVYSQVIAVDSTRYQIQPRNLRDFFDLAHFPGPRGLREGPKYNLELALIADGVMPWRVYSDLGSEGGLRRAFAKLDTIKPAIVWWDKVAEPAEKIARGEVAMTTVLNARIFSVETQPKIATIWDGQLYQMDVFGIPKGTPRKKRAVDFIRFVTGPEPLADISRYLPYGPARRSAAAHVGRNPETNAEMEPHLPTAPENFGRALEVDPDWWAAHGAAIEARWDEWKKQ